MRRRRDALDSRLRGNDTKSYLLACNNKQDMTISFSIQETYMPLYTITFILLLLFFAVISCKMASIKPAWRLSHPCRRRGAKSSSS